MRLVWGDEGDSYRTVDVLPEKEVLLDPARNGRRFTHEVWADDKKMPLPATYKQLVAKNTADLDYCAYEKDNNDAGMYIGVTRLVFKGEFIEVLWGDKGREPKSCTAIVWPDATFWRMVAGQGQAKTVLL